MSMDDAKRRVRYSYHKLGKLIRNLKPNKRKWTSSESRTSTPIESPTKFSHISAPQIGGGAGRGATDKASTVLRKDGDVNTGDEAQILDVDPVLIQHEGNKIPLDAGDTAPEAEPQDMPKCKLESTSAPASDAAEELETWFDDQGLENSRELQMLRQDMSEPSIKTSDGVRSPHLDQLVDSANNPPETLKELHESIGYLGTYIDSMEEDKKKDRSERETKEQAEQANKPLSTATGISPSMKSAFKLMQMMLKKSAKVGLKAAKSTLFVADALTDGTYYQVAVKAILLFTDAYKSTKALTADIMSIFDKLDDYRKEMAALLKNIKSAPMSKAISKFFVAIVAFVASAGSYLRHGMFPKMVKQLGGQNDKFQGLMDQIKGAYGEVRQVMEFAHVMVTLKALSNTEELRDRTTVIMQQLGKLNKALPPELSTQLAEVHERTKFHAELHIQNVREQLFRFEKPYEPLEEMLFNKRERIFLSPRDRWQRQLKYRGPSHDIRSLVWVTGHVSRRNVSWVSSFSVDLVHFFRNFSSFDVAYIFCKRGPDSGEPFKPTLLIKGLIAQLMDMYPTIALSNLRRLSLDRFRAIEGEDAAKTPSSQENRPPKGVLAWELLEDMLQLMDQVLEQRGRQVLLLIDRLDLCVSEEGFSVMRELIPRLQNLGHQRRRVQVIITTARISVSALPESYLKRGPEWLLVNNSRIHR